MSVADWSVLEWTFVTELVLLATAGMFWLISLSMQDPHDPIVLFYRTFWKILLRRHVKLAAAVNALDVEKAKQYEQMKASGNVEGIKDLLRDQFDQQEFNDAEVSAIVADSLKQTEASEVQGGEETGPSRAASIAVTVVPFASRDELISFKRDGVVINVTCGPEEGSANKAVIDLVAAALGVKAYQLSLIKGHYRANKVVQIAGLDQAQVEAKAASFS